MKYEENVWYGWNGGECPVHPETAVDFMADNGSMSSMWREMAAKQIAWTTHTGCFRVIKEHKEPREFWLVMSRSGHTIMAAESVDAAKEFSKGANGRSIIHVREVLE